MDHARLLRRRRCRVADPLQLIALGWWACSFGPPRPPGALLIVSERDGTPQVWQVAATGTPVGRLAVGPGTAFPGPADPQGTHALVVAVEDDPQGHRETPWLVPLGGGDPIRLAPPAGRCRSPVWAPDGAYLVFESDANSFRDLYRVARDGTALQRVTVSEHGSFEPTVSADGRTVVFAASGDSVDLYRIGIDGTGRTQITRGPEDDVAPAFAPDGARIAFSRGGAVWTMPAQGGDPTPLLPADHGRQTAFAWSPDGRSLAVVVQVAPRDLDIQVVDASNGRVISEYGGPGVDEHPSWSPDGEWLAWTAGAGPEADVVAVRVGHPGPPRNVTMEPGPDWLPRWLLATP